MEPGDPLLMLLEKRGELTDDDIRTMASILAVRIQRAESTSQRVLRRIDAVFIWIAVAAATLLLEELAALL